MLNSTATLQTWQELFEERLNEVQRNLYPADDQSLHPASRYALAGQGKRIRPMLCLASTLACGGDPKSALDFAVALEMIHTYSLVHDDLPCMDDDELRRGRATTHVIYDEATAMLAGDALLTDAFQIIANVSHLAPMLRLEAIQKLSRAVGGQGMVMGQALDMHWTGRSDFARSDLDQIHANKTGALIAAACVLGGLAADSSRVDLERLEKFGSNIGLAFQIIDDVLDTSEGTGKSKGKDEDSGKLTYLKVMSQKEALAHAKTLTDVAIAQLENLKDASLLKTLGLNLLDRKN